jgi:hypothetical protein
MDNYKHKMILAIDALVCSIHIHLKVLEGMKALMMPEEEEPMKKVMISTFEPPVDDPYPPCLHCNRDCTMCQEVEPCHEFQCLDCDCRSDCVI